MKTINSPIRGISDTARWVAVYRARESARPDAVFHDPFAQRLAGERGEEIARSMPFAEKNTWPFVARTWIIDQLIGKLVEQGFDMVINLAAGLDARPYRLQLPSSLQWVEIDLPEILEYKEEVLSQDRPNCRLERIKLDLSEEAARRELFANLGRTGQRALTVAEGLLVYLSEEEVGSLARDLAAQSAFQNWIIDLMNPPLLRMLREKMSAPLEQAGLPLRFSPQEGPEFFPRYGWKAQEIHSLIHVATRLKRVPLFLRLVARISSPRYRAKTPWSAVCLLEQG